MRPQSGATRRIRVAAGENSRERESSHSVQRFVAQSFIAVRTFPGMSRTPSDDAPAADNPILRGACPAFGCSPVALVRAADGSTRASCPRCGWQGPVDREGRVLLAG